MVRATSGGSVLQHSCLHGTRLSTEKRLRRQEGNGRYPGQDGVRGEASCSCRYACICGLADLPSWCGTMRDLVVGLRVISVEESSGESNSSDYLVDKFKIVKTM